MSMLVAWRTTNRAYQTRCTPRAPSECGVGFDGRAFRRTTKQSQAVSYGGAALPLSQRAAYGGGQVGLTEYRTGGETVVRPALKTRRQDNGCDGRRLTRARIVIPVVEQTWTSAVALRYDLRPTHHAHAMAIFVSYRRSDSESITGRIDDHLRLAFGHSDVYRDIDSIPPGVDFIEHLQDALSQCDAFIAVMGPRWVTERLEDEKDFVRIEIEAALRRNLSVIPVLVEGAELPRAERIPSDLHGLLRRQAIRISSGSDFRIHVQRLVESIQKIRQERAMGDPSRKAEALGDVGIPSRIRPSAATHMASIL